MEILSQYFKNRLDSKSMLTILGIVSIPFHFWTFYSLFEDFEAWIPIFDFWDLVGAWSYTFLFVIAEIIIVALYLVLVNYLVPKKLARGSFVEISFVIVLELCAVALIVQNNGDLFRSIVPIFWGFIGLSLITSGVVGFLPNKVLKIISNIADRLLTLAVFFWFFDLVALIIIMIRNFS